MKLNKILTVLLIIAFSTVFGQTKSYAKNYFENGKIESEGWMINNQKTDYWFYYFDNGNVKEEGHYLSNKKYKWWVIYDKNEEIQKKCNYFDDKLDGLVVIFNKGKIIKAEKYKKNIKVKEWYSVAAFRKDYLLTSI